MKTLALGTVDQEKQQKTLATYSENAYTDPVLEDDAYRMPLPCEPRTYKLVHLKYDRDHSTLPGITKLFLFDEIVSIAEEASDGGHDLLYEDVHHAGAVDRDESYRRLFEFEWLSS